MTDSAVLDPISAPPSPGSQDPTLVRIWTDGSCPRNPGYGGWALVAERGGNLTHVRAGGVAATTNNIMELTAVREALHLANHLEEPAEVITDSQYVVKGLTEWMVKWKQNEWQRKVKGDGWQPVLNRDLWEQLDLLYAPEFMTMVWVRGHDGARFNEMADELAGQKAALFA